MRFPGDMAACMGEMRNAYKTLVRRPDGRPVLRWNDGIILGQRETGYEFVDWVCLAQDRVQWWALVNTVVGLWVPQNVGNVCMS
jgi:hypothetical protein